MEPFNRFTEKLTANPERSTPMWRRVRAFMQELTPEVEITDTMVDETLADIKLRLSGKDPRNERR